MSVVAERPVLEVKDLRTYFFTGTGVVKAVDGVSFSVHAGETLGIVGESGSGKSVTALSVLGLVPRPAGRIMGGQVLLEGEDLLEKSDSELQRIRGRRICLIPQDPMTSLDPVFSVGDQLMETLRIHRGGGSRGLREKAVELLAKVRIPAPSARLDSFPHQMSGGMRQRTIGALAIAGGPRLLIADEATTSLDATIQDQYLRLLKDLQAETGVALVFITHDFGIIAKVCDRVAVMYAGKIVETATVQELFDHPAHPYTEALMRSVLADTPEGDRLPSIEGQPPALDDLPSGCTFAPRCPYVMGQCHQLYPNATRVSAGHLASCWKLEPEIAQSRPAR